MKVTIEIIGEAVRVEIDGQPVPVPAQAEEQEAAQAAVKLPRWLNAKTWLCHCEDAAENEETCKRCVYCEDMRPEGKPE